MLYQCVDSGFHLTVNTVVRSGEVVWFDFASSTVDFTLNSGPVVEWINSFSQIKQLNGFMTFLFIIDVKNEEAFCVDCRPTLGHNILKKHQNHEMLLLEKAIRSTLEDGDEGTNFGGHRSLPSSPTLKESPAGPFPLVRNGPGRYSMQTKQKSRGKIVAGKDRILTKVESSPNQRSGEVVSVKRPSYVYWLPQELSKVVSQEQSVTDFLNILVNGKEANWDSEDPAPYLVSHVMQSPKNYLRSIVTGYRPAEYYEPLGPGMN